MQQRGSIVNCASVNATMTIQGSGAYTASKHAVHGITKTVRSFLGPIGFSPLLRYTVSLSLIYLPPLNKLQRYTQAALEARSHHIRVNAISPGFLLTPMITNITADHSGHIADSLWEKFEARQGRRAQPAEIGDAVVMLSTPRMSLINAVNLAADGGFTINEGFE